MKTLAMRFGETFSPECGTIAAHQQVIDKLGYVWYGKSGAAVSNNKLNIMKEEGTNKVLLISSGKVERYWAYFNEIKKETPKKGIPSYYKDDADKFHTWFKITKFEPAPKDIMSKCIVESSKAILSHASHYSMNPCFFIIYEEEH